MSIVRAPKLTKAMFFLHLILPILYPSSASCFTGRELLVACSKYLEWHNNREADYTAHDVFIMGQCSGFIKTFEETHAALVLSQYQQGSSSIGDFNQEQALDYLKNHSVFCRSNVVESQELESIVTNLMKLQNDNEINLDNRAVFLLTRVYKEVYPCSATTKLK